MQEQLDVSARRVDSYSGGTCRYPGTTALSGASGFFVSPVLSGLSFNDTLMTVEVGSLQWSYQYGIDGDGEAGRDEGSTLWWVAL